MVRLTDRPDMTLDVYRGRKTTTIGLKRVNSMFVLLFSRDDSKPAKLRAAESHLKLGEVSLETGILGCFFFSVPLPMQISAYAIP